MKKKEKVPFKNSVKNNIFMLKIAYKGDKTLVIMRLVMGLFTGLNHGVSIFFISEILNALDSGRDISYIFTLTALMGIYTLAYELFFAWYYKILNPTHKLDFVRLLHKSFFVKANDIDLSCYDTPEFYNDFIFSMQNCDKSILNTVDQLADLIRSLVASGSVFAVVLTVDPVIALVILGFAIADMIIRLLQNGIYYKYNIEMNELWRKSWYIEKFFSLADYAKENRLTDIKGNLLNEYDITMQAQRSADAKMRFKVGLYNLLASALSCTLTAFVLIFMAYNLIVTQTVLIGGFTVTITASWKLKNMLFDIQRKFVEMNKDSLYADKVRKFLQTEPQIKSGEKSFGEFESLEFRNVSFAYKDEKVLDNVSFYVKKGERIAFVGYNGAGKTTTTKLIMRLYDVTEGEILINGVNIKEYKIEELRAKMGAVFQDYKVFAASVAENVLGDVYTEDKKDTVINALKDSTFYEKLCELKDGINTELTREFCDTGTNLSGGEEQKIAIARVFAHNNELIIMDEPSSALDPIAEYNLNLGIDKNARDKTVVFITHRLSTTRHVSRIYMFEKGKIIEHGSHDELIRDGGKYAQMFELQANKYKV
ncbi:MAG: ABC transporter ATP-binding protein [Clostridia bacterium]|nr:ABC transporter ATP-binding protein [Clostridia bacterium]MBQ7789364.1 ABC transporter ATP-binding protein [Clostridia bacterium]